MLLLRVSRSPFPVSTGLCKRLFSTAPQSFHIPVIDFTRFRQATVPSERKQTADEIVSAFKESGFIYLAGHGIPTCEQLRVDSFAFVL